MAAPNKYAITQIKGSGIKNFNIVFTKSIITPTHSKVDQICMKFDENEVKLNLNESMVESKAFVFQR